MTSILDVIPIHLKYIRTYLYIFLINSWLIKSFNSKVSIFKMQAYSKSFFSHWAFKFEIASPYLSHSLSGWVIRLSGNSLQFFLLLFFAERDRRHCLSLALFLSPAVVCMHLLFNHLFLLRAFGIHIKRNCFVVSALFSLDFYLFFCWCESSRLFLQAFAPQDFRSFPCFAKRRKCKALRSIQQ